MCISCHCDFLSASVQDPCILLVESNTFHSLPAIILQRLSLTSSLSCSISLHHHTMLLDQISISSTSNIYKLSQYTILNDRADWFHYQQFSELCIFLPFLQCKLNICI